MVRSFTGRDIISIEEFSKDEIEHVLDVAHDHEIGNVSSTALSGTLLGNLFFEPSTRTRLSFESAMHRLGGKVTGFTDSTMTSSKKGETLYDTMKMLEHYVDVAVIRHPLEGSARWAADTVNIPVINAGDGANEHPTQTLLDLYTIKQSQGKLDGLSIVLAGDLKYGRTTHSLARACVHFGARLYFVAPGALEMPREVCNFLREKGVKFSFHRDVKEVVSKADIMYFTRIQEERFADKMEYQSLRNNYRMKASDFDRAKSNMKILHPLPRNDELDKSIDDLPYAEYFKQAKNGLFVRQALLRLVLGK
ncbi:MAG: aspartate carbamoyltransferase [Chlamydiota bacterium]|nr:aspartate carbamoyltransferase [Chlamydiota bacterium]